MDVPFSCGGRWNVLDHAWLPPACRQTRAGRPPAKSPIRRKLGIDATKKLPDEGFKRPRPPLIEMDAAVGKRIDALFLAKNGLKILSTLLSLSAVNRMKTVVTMLLVAIWIPASSHALLEHLELIHQVHTDHEQDSDGSHKHEADDHEAADGKCALSSTHVSVPVPDMVARPFLFCLTGLGWTYEFHVEREPSGLDPPGLAPPQLSHRWQFALRTAFPARAPSLIS